MKSKGNTFVKMLLVGVVIAIGVYLGVKYAGKPVTKMLVGPAENGKNYIEKADNAKKMMDKATQAAEDAIRKESGQ